MSTYVSREMVPGVSGLFRVSKQFLSGFSDLKLDDNKERSGMVIPLSEIKYILRTQGKDTLRRF